MAIWGGVGVALVTPMDEQGDVDRKALERLVEHVTAGGVDFLVALGTTAESATLTRGEKKMVVETVLAVNAGRLPVIVGVGGNNTTEVIRELKETEWLSACQGILSITPFYNKPNQEGLYAHFKALAANAPLPLCLYNVPGRTGVNLRAETLARLASECPNIVAVKEASGNFEQATEILKTRREGFSVLSGDDSIVLPLMSMGFDGVISVLANVCPRACSELVKAVHRGDYAAARAGHLRLSGLCKSLFKEGNPAGIKAALHVVGILERNMLRLPLTPVSDALYEEIREELVGLS